MEMTNTKNKVKFGLKNCHYATTTIAEDGTITYGTLKSLPGSVSLALDAEGENDPFYADDSVYYMVLNSPTIFGAQGGQLLAGGEAGPEAVVGVSSLSSMIQNAVSSQTGSITAAIASALADAGNTGDITIPVYLGGTLIDETIITAQQRMALRSGGRSWS